MSFDFDAAMDEVHEVNAANGWFEEERSFGDLIALLHAETSEMLEAYRHWKLADATATRWDGKGLPKPEGVGAEAADVFIRLLDMCYRYSIDLEFEFRRKLAHNRTRGWKHGGRTL